MGFECHHGTFLCCWIVAREWLVVIYPYDYIM